MEKTSIHVIEQRRQGKLKQLADLGPVIQGSLATIAVTCGSPNCRCARGEKHCSHILTRKVKGKTKSTYVPVERVEDVQAWTRNHRKAKQLLKEISDLSEQILKLHVKCKRARGKNLDASQTTTP